MKNKKGFTLAEVLITLAILGIVAAISMPALNNAVQKNKVPPSIRKMITTLENANERILQEGEADVISESILNYNTNYINELSKYIQGSIDKDASGKVKTVKSYGTIKINGSESGLSNTDKYKVFKLQNGSSIGIWAKDTISAPAPGSNYKGYIADILYDMNGFDKKPNSVAKDIFIFVVDNSGAIATYGSKLSQEITNISSNNWNSTTGCPNDKKPASGSEYCAGAIEENDWKVMYKY